MIGKFNCTYDNLITDDSGNVKISFSIPKDSAYAVRQIVQTIKDSPKKDLTAEVNFYRQKRSLDANAYFWKMCQLLAEALRTSKDEVYLEMLSRYGVFTHIIVKPHVVDRVTKEWRTVRNLGEVTVGGQTGIQLQCFFGSSTYDTKEMSKLIDGIVSECKEFDIPTETPDELSRIKDAWGR